MQIDPLLCIKTLIVYPIRGGYEMQYALGLKNVDWDTDDSSRWDRIKDWGEDSDRGVDED